MIKRALVMLFVLASSLTVQLKANLYVAERIDDPLNDELVKEAFRSEKFVNKVLYYSLGDAKYQVRILHNPEGKTYTATKKFRLDHWKPAEEFKITWNYKFGIITDKVAPQELIDHLSTFTNASYWDWYWNFKVRNGTYVEHEERKYLSPHAEQVTTYKLDTWFNYTADSALKPEKNEGEKS